MKIKARLFEFLCTIFGMKGYTMYPKTLAIEKQTRPIITVKHVRRFSHTAVLLFSVQDPGAMDKLMLPELIENLKQMNAFSMDVQDHIDINGEVRKQITYSIDVVAPKIK